MVGIRGAQHGGVDRAWTRSTDRPDLNLRVPLRNSVEGQVICLF